MKQVIMPALGMAQETGRLLLWRKSPGEAVTKGEPLMEVETDKTTVEIESPASGILTNVTVQPGDDVPVGQVIAVIVSPDEAKAQTSPTASTAPTAPTAPTASTAPTAPTAPTTHFTVSPVAARMAAEHGIDLAIVTSKDGSRITREDVQAYIEAQKSKPSMTQSPSPIRSGMTPASPKARERARESGIDIAALIGTGPEGAVIARDVEAAARRQTIVPAYAGMGRQMEPQSSSHPRVREDDHQSPDVIPISRKWKVAAERLSEAWRTIPHFYLRREANGSQLKLWREAAQKPNAEKITMTDLLVKVAAAALRQHPRVNASWQNGSIIANADVNVGLAVAIEDGLIVPVIHQADTFNLSDIATRRKEIITRAQAGKLTLQDLSGGTFTISNLGMYGIEEFDAIVNPPQAAILAVGAMVDKFVRGANGEGEWQPRLRLTLSCDHRVVDGVRGAQFLQTLVELIEQPLKLLD